MILLTDRVLNDPEIAWNVLVRTLFAIKVLTVNVLVSTNPLCVNGMPLIVLTVRVLMLAIGVLKVLV